MSIYEDILTEVFRTFATAVRTNQLVALPAQRKRDDASVVLLCVRIEAPDGDEIYPLAELISEEFDQLYHLPKGTAPLKPH